MTTAADKHARWNRQGGNCFNLFFQMFFGEMCRNATRLFSVSFQCKTVVTTSNDKTKKNGTVSFLQFYFKRHCFSAEDCFYLSSMWDLKLCFCVGMLLMILLLLSHHVTEDSLAKELERQRNILHHKGRTLDQTSSDLPVSGKRHNSTAYALDCPSILTASQAGKAGKLLTDIPVKTTLLLLDYSVHLRKNPIPQGMLPCCIDLLSKQERQKKLYAVQ